jgi:toxin YoeB
VSFSLDFSKQAISDIDFHKKSGNRAVLQKLYILLNELTKHPFEGTGKPESMKHNLSGCWSRRINREHRIVYEVVDDIVRIHSAKGHYL